MVKLGNSIWEYFIEMPEEIGEAEAREIERTATILDVRGEVCPYPQIRAKEELKKLQSGQVLVVYTDHVDAVDNVPQAIRDTASQVKLLKLGRGEYKIFIWKK